MNADQPLFACRQPLGDGLSANELDRLRREFLTLMDAAALAVQQAGYDLDDCIVDQYATLRYQGDPHEITIAVESLTDVDRLIRPFIHAHAQQFGATDSGRAVKISAIEVRARLVPAF